MLSNVLISVEFSNPSRPLEEDEGRSSRSERSNRILRFLKDAYIKDDTIERAPPDTCGWRSLVQIAQGMGLPSKSFYGKKPGLITEDLRKLLNDRSVELRYFKGERGRGGEIMRFRIAQSTSRQDPSQRLDGQLARTSVESLSGNSEAASESDNATITLSTGIEDLDEILGGGYPERSSIMINGPPGIGKESLGYWFLRSGLLQEDFCLFLTHRPIADVIKNMRAFGIGTDRLPEFITSSGSQKSCDLNKPDTIAAEIRGKIEQKKNQRIRIVTDVLSPLLVLNSGSTMYQYWTRLAEEIKNYDAVLMAFIEEAMHVPSAFASMEQLFDSVIEFRIYEQGLSLTPFLRIKKMLGLSPLQEYFRFSFTQTRMEIVRNVDK